MTLIHYLQGVEVLHICYDDLVELPEQARLAELAELAERAEPAELCDDRDASGNSDRWRRRRNDILSGVDGLLRFRSDPETPEPEVRDSKVAQDLILQFGKLRFEN
jgi:hypothetical protein